MVLAGKLIYRYDDGEDVVTAGQAFYARPGHTAWLAAGTELVKFSPTDRLQGTLEVTRGNLAEMLDERAPPAQGRQAGSRVAVPGLPRPRRGSTGPRATAPQAVRGYSLPPGRKRAGSAGRSAEVLASAPGSR